jgi:hypothetical protein
VETGGEGQDGIYGLIWTRLGEVRGTSEAQVANQSPWNTCRWISFPSKEPDCVLHAVFSGL